MKMDLNQRGFALLITITLLSFLVVLLVSLAALTQIETKIADNSQRTTVARQNALFALNIALGQLQKTSGPDQRTTATASIFSTAQANGNLSGIKAPSAGTRHWTGVWRSADITNRIYSQTPSPVLVNWLVSGNEATPDIQFSASGLATSAPSVKFGPASSISGVSSATTWASTVTIDNQPAALLVGPNSSKRRTTSGYVANPDGYVVAPLIPIKAPSLPGIPGESSEIGRYAYWVGDEGVKASYNVADSLDSDPKFTAIPAEQRERYRLRTSPKSAVQLLTNIAPVLKGYSELQPAVIANVYSPEQIDISLAELGLRAASIHDLTTYSRGVLSDAQRGGLRRDLTQLFEANALSASYAGKSIISALRTSSGEKISEGPKFGPTWDALFAYYQFTKTVGSGSPVEIRPSSLTAPAIAPIVVQNRLMFHIDFNNDNITAPPDNPGQPRLVYTTGGTRIARRVLICVSAAFVVGNPYSFPIRATNGITFSYAITSKNDAEWGIYLSTRNNQADAFPTFSRDEYKRGLGYYPILINSLQYSSGRSVLDNVLFRTPAFTLQPGEQKVFSIRSVPKNTESDYTGSSKAATVAAGTQTSPGLVNLEEGIYENGFVRHNTGISTRPSTSGSSTDGWFIRSFPGSSMSMQVALPSAKPLSGTNPEVQSNRLPEGVLQIIRDLDISANEAEFRQFTLSTGEIATEYTYPHPRPYTTIRPNYAIMPFLIHGYTFSLALPDVDDDIYTPTGNIEQAIPNYRTYSDFNLSAANVKLPPNFPLSSVRPYPAAEVTSQNVRGLQTIPPYVRKFQRGPADPLFTAAVALGDSEFQKNLDPDSLKWGSSTRLISGKRRAVFYDIPRQEEKEYSILSVGALQHVDLTGDDDHQSVSYQPRNAIGNSYFSPFISRLSAIETVARRAPKANGEKPQPTDRANLYDLSYLLNAAIWDSFFLSGISSSRGPTAGFSLNQRYEFLAGYSPTLTQLGFVSSGNIPDMADSAKRISPELAPARYLLSKGSFNINSTSVEAWKAVLGSSRGFTVPAVDSRSAIRFDEKNPQTPILRSLYQPLGADNGASGRSDEAFAGFRQLDDTTLSKLAEKIVEQVKARGPFLSLAHFVNRSLAPASDVRSRSGALQAAIDNVDSGVNSFKDDRDVEYNPSPVYFREPVSSLGKRSTGVPGWLTQADILQQIGAIISSRSDTFRVRAYGEVLDPLDGTVVGRAWCEAIVQRFPDYVNSEPGDGDSPGLLESPVDPMDIPRLKELAQGNKIWGRRYRVTSFRWLTSADI